MIDRIGAARLDRLFRLHHPRVTALAVNLTRDRSAAEDVAATTWLRATASIARLKTDDDVAAYGWLAAITRHAAADYYRPRSASEQPHDWSDAVAAGALPVAHPAEEIYLAQVEIMDRLIALDTPKPSAPPAAPIRLPLPQRDPGSTNPPTPRPAAQLALAG